MQRGAKLRPNCLWLVGVLYLLLAALPYRDAVVELIRSYGSEDGSYCWLILPLVGYLLWEKRRALSSVPRRASLGGVVPVLAGFGLYWLGVLGSEYYSIWLSGWMLALGLYWLHQGWPRLRLLGFPVCFSLFLFPLPYLLYRNLSQQLRLISSQLGVALLHLLGVSAYREGNIIDLGVVTLQVVDACSGLRYLIPLMILALLLAHRLRGRWWWRVLLVASAPPLSLITNGMRLAAVGLLCQWRGAGMAQGGVHELSGWLIFLFSLALLLGEMRLLQRLFAPGAEAGAHPAAPVGAQASTGATTPLLPAQRVPGLVGLCALLLFLVTYLYWSQAEGTVHLPSRPSLAHFPLSIGSWHGFRSSLEEPYLKKLRLTDYLLADYRNPAGESISLYLTYYERQRRDQATHSPSSCLPGSGWVFLERGAAPLPAVLGLTASRAVIRKGQDRLLVYYWFPQRGRVLAGALQLKWYLFWDALSRHRSDGGMVRVSTAIGSAEETKDAEARLASFLPRLVPLLPEFIPN